MAPRLTAQSEAARRDAVLQAARWCFLNFGFAKTSLVASQGSRSAEWQRSFAANAAANGWKTEMVWFKIVDEAPN